MSQPTEIIDENAAPPEDAVQVSAPENKGSWVGGLVKGAVVIALAIVAVMAMVGGYMGSSEAGFYVGRFHITTLEDGVVAGVNKAVQFLTHSAIAWSALAAGAVGGAYLETAARPSAQPALETEDHAKILALTQELEEQKSLNASICTIPETPALTKTEPATCAEHIPKRDSIYLAHSMIKDKDFSASELKRRVDIAAQGGFKTL